MTVHFEPGRYAANERFYCALCEIWHSDSDDAPVSHCYYCDRQLCPKYDYACISCGRSVCDNDGQICQKDDCDIITCGDCVARHLNGIHPSEAVAL